MQISMDAQCSLIARGLRIAMYSHDTMGLGHMRRNMLVAQKLAGPPLEAKVLLLGGANEINAFRHPPGVDCISLPALRKLSSGVYESRRLGIEIEDLLQLRGNILLAAVESFQPDVFIVDNVPRGALGELDATLDLLARQPLVRCVLGIRDIIDDPSSVEREWKQAGNCEVVDERYDAIWVYGDQQIYDPVSAYGWPSSFANKTTFVGYLNPRGRLDSLSSVRSSSEPEPPAGQFDVCLCGGGQDGFQLAQRFLQANLPGDLRGIVLAGPCMPEEEYSILSKIAQKRSRHAVWRFVPEADALICAARRVVAMGGYNTLCSILSYGKPALIVPRESPRLEQRIRADRFRQLGLVSVLSPSQATTAALTSWLHKDAPANHGTSLNFSGLERIPQSLAKIVQSPRKIANNRLDRNGAMHASA